MPTKYKRRQYLLDSLKQPLVGDECLLWPYGVTSKGGYGVVFFNGKNRIVHRVVYELNNGPIADDVFVEHTCNTAICYRPDHLFAEPNRFEYLTQELAKANKEECIVWPFGRDECGYGLIQKLGQDTRVHRVAWTVLNGPIPEGMYALHNCDNPPCFNAKYHIFLGTQIDNMLDMKTKNRGSDNIGSSNPRAKLNESVVAEIKRRISRGDRCQDLAKEYPVTLSLIEKIKYGHNWKNVSIS